MVSVAQLVDEADLNLVQLHDADPHRMLSWVATSELADPAPFFKGGEVLLTTALQTEGWRGEWDEYVRRLVDAGVVAIGIGTGLTHRHAPSGLMGACRRHAMNLFEVPRDTPFVAVSRRASQLLAEEDDRDARSALRHQRELTAAAVKPDGVRRVVETVGRTLGAACLLGPDGAVVHAPVGPRRADLAAAPLGAELTRMRTSATRSASTLSGPRGTVVIQPIGVRSRRPSWLAVLGPARLSEGQRGTVTAAVALLSLITEQQHEAARAGRVVRARAIELAVSGDAATARLLLTADPTAPLLPNRFRVIRGRGTTECIDDALPVLEADGVLAGLLDGELCGFARAGAAGLGTRLADAGLAVGIGREVPGSAAVEGYRTAGLALAQVAPGAVAEWGHIVKRGPLGLIDPAAAGAFAESLLGDLDAEQRELLRCFLMNHGSMLRVAEATGVHRNTVRNRIRAIEAVTGESLDEPQARVNAWLALQSLSG